MDISVIVPAHNEERHLPVQLDALLSQRWEGKWELIVVDNRSTDATAELVHRYAQKDDRVRLVHADERADKSYAMNVAVREARANSIVFCDADDEVAEGWLEAMAIGLADNEVVTGPNELDRLNPAWLANSRGRSIEGALGTFSGLFPCIRGNNFGLTSDTWSKLNGMNERFHPVEDIEFSLRCWQHGINVVGLPDAVVHYRYRQDARSLWRQGFAYGSHRPLIAKLLKEADQQTPPKFSGWKSWILLVLKAPTVLTRSGRATWVWIAGNRFGQIVGSCRYRTLLL